MEPLGHHDMAGPALQYNPKGLDLGHVIQADLQKDHGGLFRKQRGRRGGGREAASGETAGGETADGEIAGTCSGVGG